MSNLITHSLSFSQESVREYFIKPLFLGEDIKNIVDVHLDVKSSKKLDLIDALSKITKAYAQGTSFTPSTGITVTQKTVTVYAMKAEVRQNGRAFLNYVKQSLLKSGYSMNDVSGTLFEKIIMELFFNALKKDFNRQIFFGDSTKELTTSDTAIGTADTNYNVYDGFWTWIEEAVTATTIPAAQYIDLNSTTYVTTAGIAQVITITLSGTTGTANITVNGTAYLATFDTSLTVTGTNFTTANAATLQARWNGVTLTNGGAGELVFTAKWKGESITATIANATGNLTGTAVATTAVTRTSAPKAGGALAAFSAMYAAMPAVMKERKGECAFLATASMVDNYRTSLESVSAGSEAAYFATIDGVKRLAYRGVPIIEMLSWDSIIDTDFGNVHPNRAILTITKNLIVGTDGSSDMLTAELFYDQNTQENVFRVEYFAGTQYLFPDYIVAAY